MDDVLGIYVVFLMIVVCLDLFIVIIWVVYILMKVYDGCVVRMWVCLSVSGSG